MIAGRRALDRGGDGAHDAGSPAKGAVMSHEYCPECSTFLGGDGFAHCPNCGADFEHELDEDLDDYDDELSVDDEAGD